MRRFSTAAPKEKGNGPCGRQYAFGLARVLPSVPPANGSIQKVPDGHRGSAPFTLSPVMASTAIDVEQSSLNHRVVGAQPSLEFGNEKAGFNDSPSSSEHSPGTAWRPEDA